MYILGISAFYHDSAATLIKDGEIMAAAQEERFTRIKQDASFPKNAISFCLDSCSINLNDIEKIVFYDDPQLKFKRILTTYVDFFPKSIPFIFKSLPIWLTKKLYWKSNLIDDFRINFNINIDKNKISNTTHHRSHAASAFFASPYEESAVLVLDGVGEFETTTLWYGKDNKLKQIKSLKFPHSIGLLYSAITYYTGFKVNSGEYKVMGLAPYGEPKYVEIIKNNLIKIDNNGTFELDMSYFDFATGSKMTNDKFHKLFGQNPRVEETEISQFEMDMARSIQDVAEEVMIKLSTYIQKETSSKNLCLAGGVSLNCVGNGKILKANIFENIWIQPAAGDAGGSLGAALDYYYDTLNNERIADNKNDFMKGSYLGPESSEEEIEIYLKSIEANFIKYNNIDELIEVVSGALSDEKVIGWHQGKMEFGPRSLGGRSILGDPRSQEMQKTMNLKIKYRESFRPFAPSVLRENVSDYFDLDVDSPYMLLVAPINQSMINKMSDDEDKLFGIEKLNIKRSTIPAVTHVDYSARVQTVHNETNPKYHKLLEAFYKKTGCPVLVNTSFNVRGEPIVCTPEDSYRCFMRTEMDLLVINNYIMLKDKQPNYKDKGNWQEEFKLD
jgi:carbamoyltransferase